MKKINLTVSEFALPAPRVGSIEPYSGFRSSSSEGIEIHQRIQSDRKKQYSSYRSEVLISQTFESSGFEFKMGGRIDGLFDEEVAKIEEIKSSFSAYELLKAIRDVDENHPYCWQVKTYGYFYWLQTKKLPILSLHLVSTRNRKSVDLNIDLDIYAYENWLQIRLSELVNEAKIAEKNAKRRKKVAKIDFFPFEEPRLGQMELIQTVEEGIKNKKPMMIQAPTGLGKTVGVLYPLLRESLERGQRLIYVTPKNSQHSVAEDAIDSFQEKGANIRAMTLTAKSKICMKSEVLCNPEFCEYAKNHYTKVAENNLLEQISKKRSLTSKTFKKFAEKFQVCPFELQLDSTRNVDAVICDYNYVFAPRSALSGLMEGGLDQEGRPNLIIDEAHNLPSRAMDYYSPELSSLMLQKMLEEVGDISENFRYPTIELLKDCLSLISTYGLKNISKPSKMIPATEEFLKQEEEIQLLLSSYLNSDAQIKPKDVLLNLSYYWSQFTSALEFLTDDHPEFFATYHPNPPVIKITCSDASQMLEEIYDFYENVVAFSATLKPFEFYGRLTGLAKKESMTAEFSSPFPKAYRKLLIIPQISSKFSDRESNYLRIAKVIYRISEVKRGNYFAFFPSFDFLDRVHEVFSTPSGFNVLKQTRGMKLNEIEFFLESLKNFHSSHIIFAVQGGVFSEGVDYPGKMIIGSFVVGAPLPALSLEREKMREYYQKHFSAGFEYAYAYPAMAKAVQSAGRVIRSETDTGIVILMDHRFIEPSFSQSMPKDWFQVDPNELISNQILADISKFWTSVEPA
ncbi:MAG: 2 domain protein [Bacteriovoracaceae bacterium]|nr:2 domain protein [Bacteriovoracaceae bacterium]